jgi:putative DNA primase/helicase
MTDIGKKRANVNDRLPSTAKELAEHLGGKREGASWKALCPTHEDRRASLSIDDKDGKVVVYCHAGCKQDVVLDHLRDRGLWPRPNGKTNGHMPKSQIVAVYDYVDESGKLHFQAVRYEPKGFKQRRPSGSGGWEWNLKGVRILPYRLPELIEAIAKGQKVFVVEGEKDVDNLAKAGVTATCNAGGAGKWKAEHAAFLKGADVGIIPDNDEAGRQHADIVRRSLVGVAARACIVGRWPVSNKIELPRPGRSV